MASLNNQQQQTWVPYETPKDCSQGICSIYCPQWCYIIFPPPPPFSFDSSSSSSSATFSPLVIAIIGIIASAFLLVSYYTIISKYCGTFSSLRRRLSHNPDVAPDPDDDPTGQSRRYDTWHISPSNGLDEALIDKITVCKYKRGDGLVDGTDCSVCLSEFREDETLRLLPKCSHAFHLQCIDTWLKSHSNCPLCRANIVSVNLAPPQLPAPTLEIENSHREGENRDVVVVVIEDLERSGVEEENDLESDEDASKDPLQVCDSEGQEENYGINEMREDVVQPIRRSFSMDSLHQGRVSIADMLQISMEEEYLSAKGHELLVGGGVGSSRRGGGENSKGSSRSRGLHCVMSPVPMKRSVSSGRFCLARHGKGRKGVLLI